MGDTELRNETRPQGGSYTFFWLRYYNWQGVRQSQAERREERVARSAVLTCAEMNPSLSVDPLSDFYFDVTSRPANVLLRLYFKKLGQDFTFAQCAGRVSASDLCDGLVLDSQLDEIMDWRLFHRMSLNPADWFFTGNNLIFACTKPDCPPQCEVLP